MDLFFKIVDLFFKIVDLFFKIVDLLFERVVRSHLPNPPWLRACARRHVDNIKARYDNTTSKEDNADYSAIQPTSNETAMEDIAHPDTVMPVATSTTDDTTVPELVVATRPTRVRRPPKRFDNFVVTGEVTLRS